MVVHEQHLNVANTATWTKCSGNVNVGSGVVCIMDGNAASRSRFKDQTDQCWKVLGSGTTVVANGAASLSGYGNGCYDVLQLTEYDGLARNTSAQSIATRVEDDASDGSSVCSGSSHGSWSYAVVPRSSSSPWVAGDRKSPVVGLRVVFVGFSDESSDGDWLDDEEEVSEFLFQTS
jgi:hypothetical protein